MSKSIFRRTAVLLIAWLLLIGILSVRGFFTSFSQLPPRLSFALLIPLPLVLLFIRSGAGKQLLHHIKPQWLIYLQSFRILVEIALWLLVRNGSLPVQMSFEGRNFDILTGLLAFPIGYYCFVKRSWPPLAALLYNIAGLVLLVNIVTITALSLPTPLRVFHNQPDSSLLTKFPFIYLPGLLVPLAYTLHILSLRQLGLFRHSRQDSPPGIISAKEWFSAGGRLPYDTVAKSIIDNDKALQLKRLFVFNKNIIYAKQNPGKVISFLPGFPSGSYDWVKIDALIEKQHPLNRLYIDYIGQGESDKPEKYPYSTFERADLVEAIWKHHHIDSTFVVSFDYSSLVVMELLQRQQEKIEKGIQPSTLITKVLLINGGYFTDGHSHPDRLNLLPIVEKMHSDVCFYIVGSNRDQFEPKQVTLAKERISKFGVDIQVLSGGHMITMEQPQLLTDKILAIANERS